MKKKVEKIKNKQEGFSLTELVVVIAIIVAIAFIAVPNILDAVDNARRATDVTNAAMILKAATQVEAQKVETDADAILLDANFPAAGDEFEEALADVLKDKVPKPEFQGEVFKLVVASDGSMSVETNDGNEVAPEPSGDYEEE